MKYADHVDYELVDSLEGFKRAASALSRGSGRFALDTERASSFRYDDRAFLVQVTRPGAPTFLIAPEGLREEFADVFAPVLNDEAWILHAAGEDIPSLSWLGLKPGELFDTELAGRLGGFRRPNLAAMVEEFVGVHLEKGHGREDWSQSPLPQEWAEYAALDVAYLEELATAEAEFLANQNKLSIAEQEFAYLVSTGSAQSEQRQRTWRDLKGIKSIRSRASLNVAKHLWEDREYIARVTDTSPGALLSNRALIEIAKEMPSSKRSVHRIRGVSRKFDPWDSLVQAREDSPAVYPLIEREHSYPPGKSYWEREHPDSWQVLQQIRADVLDLSEDIEIPVENILAPKLLSETVWETTNGSSQSASWTTHRMASLLGEKGAREWQIQLTAPIIVGQL
ncbi:HRDC domain-containing protein [Corynebacterium lubricantis]|uniref:HRDC domain-containing protein n=1 Tax=Corynebacterium lubricantis TaxID=541095 RepID=UPI00037173FB|nr:HRDC domain-containing protein [Corynebacterium lubricantis]